MTANISDRAQSYQTSGKITGQPVSVGTGFKGVSFRHNQFDGHMDPLIMVDHYTMTSPTFGAHPHAGLSAVSILFEDTQGLFNNRDSLGNNFNIAPGDLYWLNAASGAVHDEAPLKEAAIHGLQLFVNLPARLKTQAPSSLHVPTAQMPVFDGEGYRVRLVLGQSNGVDGVSSPVLPFTVLDGKVNTGHSFSHNIALHHSAWVYAVEHSVSVTIGQETYPLSKGESIAFTPSGKMSTSPLLIEGTAEGKTSHFVILSGQQVQESFVQQGPFAMNSLEEIQDIHAKYQRGELGSVA